MAKTQPNLTPHEADEQKAIFARCELLISRYPELKHLYHIPNGGSRNHIEAAHLQKQGVKPGVPDICLPVARGGYHGLYIELKRRAGGVVSKSQKEWLSFLARQGYCACVCRGADEAMNVILKYLGGGEYRAESQEIHSD